MKSLSKKSEKVIKEMTEGRLFEPPLLNGQGGARMMLRGAHPLSLSHLPEQFLYMPGVGSFFL